MSDIHQVECDVCKGKKTVQCYSCAGHGILYVREDRPPTHAELELAVRGLQHRLEAAESRHRREMALLAPTDREKELLAQNRALEDRNRLLRRELAQACDNNYRRNLELDAMHYVWCDGGCEGGVHRYDDKGTGAICEDLVRAAESNVARLRTWWDNHKYREKNAQQREGA